jgi:hypothetical protein
VFLLPTSGAPAARCASCLEERRRQSFPDRGAMCVEEPEDAERLGFGDAGVEEPAKFPLAQVRVDCSVQN